jgi:hypothetical protein
MSNIYKKVKKDADQFGIIEETYYNSKGDIVLCYISKDPSCLVYSPFGYYTACAVHLDNGRILHKTIDPAGTVVSEFILEN